MIVRRGKERDNEKIDSEKAERNSEYPERFQEFRLLQEYFTHIKMAPLPVKGCKM